MTSYWQVNNKKWIRERKSLWLPIKNRLIDMEEFDKEDLKVFETYFLTGEMDFTGDYREVVPLLYMFAWHPSDDKNIWLEEFDKMQLREDAKYSIPFSIRKTYMLIERFGSIGIYYVKDAAADCFMGREKKLYNIFFNTSGVFEKPNFKDSFEDSINKARNRLCISAFSYPSLGDGKTDISFLKGFPRYILPELKYWLTDEIYDRYAFSIKGNANIDEAKFLSLKKELYDYYHLSISGTNVDSELQEIVKEWVAQIEAPETSPKWKNLWQEVKLCTAADFVINEDPEALEEPDEEEEFDDQENEMIEHWPVMIDLIDKHNLALNKDSLVNTLNSYHHFSALLTDLTGIKPIDFGNLTEIIDESVESLITGFFESIEVATSGKIKIKNLSLDWLEEDEIIEVSFKTGIQLKPYKFEIEVDDCFRFIADFTDWLRKQLKNNIFAIDTDTCTQVFMLPKELAIEIKNNWPMDYEHYERITYPE